MGKARLPKRLLSELSRLRDGDWAAAERTLNYDLLFLSGCELHSRAIVGSAKVGCWVVDMQHDFYLSPGFLSELDSWLRLVNAVQTSLNDWLESGRPTLLYSLAQSWLDCGCVALPEDPWEASIPSYAVVVSALVLLSLVYQYLTGNVDRGGSKAYSRSSLDFRDVYVAIVLFLGAYVWIKFREVARLRGVYPRTLVHKHGGTKVVYEARLKPPMWNGRKMPRLDLGRFATPQDAHNKFLIAAFYYNRGAGLLDGWFQVAPMSEEEQSLTGLEKKKWVIGQAKKVYEDFKKEEEADVALLLQELLGTSEDHLTPKQHEVNVDFSMMSLLNSTEHQQPTLASQVENSGMGVAMLDNHSLECASHSFDGIHEGLVLPNGHSLGFQEGSTLSVSQVPPNSESGMILSTNEPLDLLQTLVQTLQQQISLLQQQSFLERQQFSEQQRQNQELSAQNLQLQHQQRIQQQQLQESRIQNPQWPCQFCHQQPQLHVINQGFPDFDVEMEQSMHQQNYSSILALLPDGGEV